MMNDEKGQRTSERHYWGLEWSVCDGDLSIYENLLRTLRGLFFLSHQSSPSIRKCFFSPSHLLGWSVSWWFLCTRNGLRTHERTTTKPPNNIGRDRWVYFLGTTTEGARCISSTGGRQYYVSVLRPPFFFLAGTGFQAGVFFGTELTRSLDWSGSGDGGSLAFPGVVAALFLARGGPCFFLDSEVCRQSNDDVWQGGGGRIE